MKKAGDPSSASNFSVPKLEVRRKLQNSYLHQSSPASQLPLLGKQRRSNEKASRQQTKQSFIPIHDLQEGVCALSMRAFFDFTEMPIFRKLALPGAG
jgi:hypothetical protein